VLELGAAVGARGVNLIVTGAADASLDAVVDAFGAACDRAARFGLQSHLEFSRSRPPPDLRGALEVVRRAARPASGVMLDVWHVHFGPGSFGDLAAAPGHLVTGVQLCDAPAHEPERYDHATRHARLLPGRGALPLSSLLQRLGEIGCRAPLTLEVFDTRRLERIGAVAFARELGEAARAVLGAAAPASRQAADSSSSRSRMGPKSSG
jgi:sugar phosphate isomerase/epimerase